jgi:hypothetical protein
MAKVILKGKTIVEGGRFRGETSPGMSVHWTATEQCIEVEESVAREIEADPTIITVRLDAMPPPPPAPRATIQVTPEQQDEIDAMLTSHREAAESSRAEAEKLRAEIAALKAASSGPGSSGNQSKGR